MNEELDDGAVAAAVAGYPRTGRDLADGYMLAALVIRAMYDGADPEIDRALRLYTGDTLRLEDLSRALVTVAAAMVSETDRRDRTDRPFRSGELPGERTRLIPRYVDPPGPRPHGHWVPSSAREAGDLTDRCKYVWRLPDGTAEECGRPYGDYVHHVPTCLPVPDDGDDTRAFRAPEIPSVRDLRT